LCIIFRERVKDREKATGNLSILEFYFEHIEGSIGALREEYGLSAIGRIFHVDHAAISDPAV